MKWEKVEIRNICKIKSGKRLPSGEDFSIAPTPFPYIRARDIKNGVISCDNFVFLTEKVRQKIKQYIVNTNDIVITIVGASVGDVGYVTKNLDGYNLTENAVRLTDFNKNVNPHYIFYVLNSEKYQKLMQKLAGGSAQAKLGIYKIEAIQLELPKKEIQDKIERYLSAYDDLIKNNQKQIKLLEEAAQRLYKEWFVDLRFPGYETTPIIDGIPQRWRKVTLENISPIITGKKDANFGTEDGVYPFFTCSQEPIKAPSYSFDTSAVILSGNGDFNVKLYRGKFEAYQRTYVLSPYDKNYLYLLYNAVNTNMNKLLKGASGSTIKFLTKGMIDSIPIYIPTEELLGKYYQNAESIQQKLETLKKIINKAKEARDRLLPKLISGELEV